MKMKMKRRLFGETNTTTAKNENVKPRTSIRAAENAVGEG
jgi:hypothetical protein